MLIEFSVANFRSFRERQTLSMVASPKLHKRNNVLKSGLTGQKFPDLLKVAVIYGPNASGKSNLLKAMSAISQIARRSPNDSSKPLPVSVFGFDPSLANQPSVFDVHFISGGVRYQFELMTSADRIYRERLIAFPKGEEKVLYDRQYINNIEKYEFGDSLLGGNELFETWRKLTSPSILFIAQAVANSNEELSQLKGPFEWLKGGMRCLLNGMRGLSAASQTLVAQGEEHADEIAAFLREVDVPIAKIRVESDASVTKSDDPDGDQDNQNSLLESIEKGRSKTILTHKVALGQADLSYADESEGTKNLIGFWLPWSVRDFKKFPGRLLVVDELDSSLHPSIVAALVAKHLAAPNPTQLIFTTHDTHLMDAKLLRRDQIWVTDRDVNGATQLRSIYDFEGREGEDIEKRYFEGRYRGLPFVKKA